MIPKDLLSRVTEVFDSEMEVREDALTLSRKIIRFCANAIRAAHRADFPEAERLLGDARDSLKNCQELLKEHPRFYYAGFLQNAEKEFAEASATLALINGKDIPDYGEIGVSHVSYLLGLSDAVGEMRRYVLDRMRTGKLEGLDSLLRTMEDIYYVLASVDYPDSVTRGLRRLTDQTRYILERTRGDLTTALGRESLKRSLVQLEERLP